MRYYNILVTIIIVLCIPLGGADAKAGKKDSALRFLMERRESLSKHPSPSHGLPAEAGSEKAVVTVKFDHILSASEIASYESDGYSFYSVGGGIARTGAIYPVRIPWEMIDRADSIEEILRIESGWKPAVFPLLDVSSHEIEADSVWKYNDPLGFPLTGGGMRIADFDTGIDVFHPSFFYADGDTFDWLDDNDNGVFDSGYDAVDRNGNGYFDLGEMLRFYDGWVYDPAMRWGGGYPSNNDGVYQTWWDWLYADENLNGTREYGPTYGYTDSDPAFGEPLYITLDANGNGALDVGEKLVALGTSKVFATMNEDEIERVRGTDIILTDHDTNGHGTSVSGILAGGTVGHHIFTGIAPGAEILAGAYFSGNPISLLIPWARSRGADAMLYEFGGFVWDFLDGSSLEEELITIENSTTIQVTPSGNLGRGRKHAIATVPALDAVTLRIYVPSYGGSDILYMFGSTLWRTDISDLTFRLKSPAGGQIVLDGATWSVDNYYVWYDFDTSPRGTCKLDLYVDCDANPDILGTWELEVENGTASPVEVISNIADHLSSWAGGAEFTNYYTDERNVTFPATADGAFVNGSYSTRGYEGYGGVGGGSIAVGEISAFSGRGARIDGLHLLDICSPGNYDVWSCRSHSDGAGYPVGSYRQFSGTSAAGPHVAAAAVLVQQAFPLATMEDVAHLLTSHALADSFTGPVYNDTWGYGKLRLLGAVGFATAVEDMAGGLLPPSLLLDQNYPNPFNPSTSIPFYLPASGRARVAIYDVKGRLVSVVRDRFLEKGPHSVRWDGTDSKGRTVASGLYFCVLTQNGGRQTRKMILMR